MSIYKRTTDLLMYSIIATSIILSIPHIKPLNSVVMNSFELYRLFPYYLQLTIIFTLGMTIKKLLIYVGDYRLNHEFTPISNLKNIPLRYSAILSSLLLSIHYEMPLHEIQFDVAIVFFSGLILGGANDIHSIKDNEHRVADFNYYTETPIKTDQEDLLNRGAIIKKYISSFEGNNVHTAAILGDYGTGKTSLTYLLEQHLPNYYLVCRINSWGVDPSQIQKTTIEFIVERLSHETSTAELKSIAQKYLSNLKGASTLGLDILSVFESLQKDPSVQIDKIDNHLSKINKKMLIIIEDIDRHSQTQTLLSELLSLFDKLRTTKSIYALITIGTNTTKEIDAFTSIINRSIGFYEYIPRLNGVQAKNIIIKHFQHEPPIQFKTHSENIMGLWTSQSNNIAQLELLSYYPNIRELGDMINLTLAYWRAHLNRRCNLNDVFFINTLKKYHLSLYSKIVNAALSKNISIYDSIKESSDDTITNNQRKMVYYFTSDIKRGDGVQTIAFDNYKYIKTITDFIDNNSTDSTPEDDLFNKIHDLFEHLLIFNDTALTSVQTNIIQELLHSLTIHQIYNYISILQPNLDWQFSLFLLLCATDGYLSVDEILEIPFLNKENINADTINLIHKISNKCQTTDYEKFIAIYKNINNDKINTPLSDEWFNDDGALFSSYLSTIIKMANSSALIVNSPVYLSVFEVMQKIKPSDSNENLILSSLRSLNVSEENTKTIQNMIEALNHKTNLGIKNGNSKILKPFKNAIESYKTTFIKTHTNT
ncbi:P-loop NTPase fold protein [Aeromonas veronii]|uniref:P-loop NTPase fold protein n=1 Tax=Aeromonas veronii TaxID=654 RepID=UPI003BA0AEBA